ncbi:hypothetical protein BDP27DRAFT_1316958 [Rhodocollybia butyracea]|uniref:Protein SQS1 n=1 Tax=Rhodocollybia butyracea TaxID=206335 RepID=A0A9P5PXG6_9AGAR|nr:hypothetical protein BDP27DRAFT_1316958 [Rhodocollybia butyracea]
MARGRRGNNNNEDFRGGHSRGSPRGNGNRGGRGFRGRGRGGRGRGGGYIPSEETDFVLQVWDNNNSYSPHRGSGRGRARGGGLGFSPEGPSHRGYDSPGKRGRGRGRGRGGFDSPRNGSDSRAVHPNAPLSMLLRPLLRPIVFVPATKDRYLFQAEEELIQPIVEEAGAEEQSHVPTAERVARLFSGNFRPPIPDSLGDSNENTEGLEEIDFSDVGKFQEAVDNIALTTNMVKKEPLVEESFSGKINFKPVNSEQDTVMDDPDQSNFVVVDSAAVITTSTTMEDADAEINHVSSTIQSIAIQDNQPTEVQDTPVFFVDTDPSASRYESDDVPISDRVQGPALGFSDDDDIVVYVAPHPRSGRIVANSEPSAVPPTEIHTTSVLTGLPIGMVPPAGPAPTIDSISFFSLNPTAHKDSTKDSEKATSTSSLHRPPIFTSTKQQTPFKLKSRQRGQWAVKRKGVGSSFASRGANVSEAQLTNWNRRDPRKNEQRRGDSDVDWGDEDSDEDGWEDASTDDDGIIKLDDAKEEEVHVVNVGGRLDVGASVRSRKGISSGAAEGMDVDPELELDVDALRRFAEGMSPIGSKHVTMNDIADEERMREEDEDDLDMDTSDDEDDDDDDDDDDEVEKILDLEERMLIAEPGEEDEDESSEDDDGDNQSPKSSFQARLERLRKGAHNDAKGKGKARDVDDDDDDDDWALNRTWAEADDDFIAHMHDILDEDEDIISGRDRKAKKQIFRAVYNGDFEEVKPARKVKDKYKDLPADLAALWNKDRAKKALYKQERELERLAAAADPLTKKKGGKKGRKAMLAAANFDPTITVIPNRVIDMTTLVQQIQRFIDDIGGPNTMSLPPANKQTRKNIHELANAFNLKSQSKGKGEARYTTLTKTTMSGMRVNRQKVAKIVRRSGGDTGFVGGSDVWKKFAQRSQMPKHREGDEVGKTAPKIDETNIGFKMLASMGWTEGDSIGLSGGLQNPLTAVIKHTKLGLGATK